MRIAGAAFYERVRATRDRMPWWSRHLLAVGAVLVVLGAFLRLTLGVFEDARVTSFDQAAMSWVASHRSPALTRTAVELTALGSGTLVVLFTVGALCVLLVARDFRGVLHLALAIAGSAFITDALKSLLARPRPLEGRLVEAGGFSYPSGHAVSAAVLYVTLALVGSRHFRGPDYRHMLVALAAVVTVVVAATRVYLGVHYPTDVASGTALGAGWAVLLAAAFAYADERSTRLRSEREQKDDPHPPG
jgi:undecaprenyl-diphosphatase